MLFTKNKERCRLHEVLAVYLQTFLLLSAILAEIQLQFVQRTGFVMLFMLLLVAYFINILL